MSTGHGEESKETCDCWRLWESSGGMSQLECCWFEGADEIRMRLRAAVSRSRLGRAGLPGSGSLQRCRKLIEVAIEME
jgi:hypothetical protein